MFNLNKNEQKTGNQLKLFDNESLRSVQSESEMLSKKQNLVLVFEVNDDERIIDSNLVRICMNRFIIGEDNQNDIHAVYQLSKHQTSEFRGFDITDDQRKIIKEIIVRLNHIF